MKAIKVTCLQCGYAFETNSFECDDLGWYTTCPECEGSFDVDIDDRYDEKGEE